MKYLPGVMLMFCSPMLFAQVTPEKVKEYITQPPAQSARLNEKKMVSDFYELNNYQLVWISAPGIILRNDLLLMINSVEDLGLDRNDYQFGTTLLNQPPLPGSASDSISTDVRLTDIALHFLKDVKIGNKPPTLGYIGIRPEPDSKSLIEIFYTYCRRQSLQGIIPEIEPRSREYVNTKNFLVGLNKKMLIQGLETVIKSNKADSLNKPLHIKLFLLNIVDSLDHVTNAKMLEGVKKAQAMFNLSSDGALRSPALKALNIPLSRRISEVKTALNNIRWQEGIRDKGSLAVINIPATMFYLFDRDSLSLFSKIIAGKPSTPTPTLSSIISEVIIYPYWNVPYKIASRELLPSIKRNPGYLAANNFQVLNRHGNVINPYSVNWHSYSAGNFPFSIRQGTGCDNSLGVLKFNFYNPFTVYIHDTPGKSLFATTRRFYSHGCMRIEKPLALASILLQEKASEVEKLTKQCLRDQTPKTINLSKSLPLMVIYSTAWYNEKGEIRFYEDVYHKLTR